MNILLIFGTPARHEAYCPPGGGARPFPPLHESGCRDMAYNAPISGARIFTPPNERFVPMLRSLRQNQSAAGSAMGFTVVTDIATVRRPFSAVFIGGGLRELELFQALHGILPCFPIPSTGGAAANMLDAATPPFAEATARDLRGGVSYATLWARIMNNFYPTITRAAATPLVSDGPPVLVSNPGFLDALDASLLSRVT